MYGKAVLVIATTVIILLMLFGNAKVRVFSVLVNQIKVFKNAKTEKLSWLSIPIEISILFGNSEHPFPERKNMPFRSRVQPFI